MATVDEDADVRGNERGGFEAPAFGCENQTLVRLLEATFIIQLKRYRMVYRGYQILYRHGCTPLRIVLMVPGFWQPSPSSTAPFSHTVF